ncbi:MAG: 23S rRNA (uracil(1939)-C(5))-methyltransferase RlmD [Catonella sp.]|uniref:23S rRNA (uracil(1939)-C(5))-methyltransferase RlmD n=1 Tax=Catonella sp. TaxID=2382125 RepID=UPI003FA02E29
MFEKNEILELKIESIGSEGEGIAHVNGYTLFVKDTVPKDRIEARVVKVGKNFGYARCERIIEPSPDRIEAVCPISKRCGGCQFQHLSYEAELKFKQEKVFNCIKRIGGFKDEEIPMLPIIGCEEIMHYRNKAQFPIGVDKNGEIVTGFYAERSHEIVDTTKCYIQVEENELILKTVKAFMHEYGISAYEEKINPRTKKPEKARGLVRHIMTRKGFATGEIGICVVINGNELPNVHKFIAMVLKAFENRADVKITGICININKKVTNVIFGDELKCVYGKPYIVDMIEDIKFQISPFSFYQVNPMQTKKLYGKALEFAGLTGEEVVWDLYCGIGTISLFLAKKAKEVYGVEIVEAAVENARENAKLNGIENAYFTVGKAEDEAKKLPKPDVIVVDPPRKGCDEKLIGTIMNYKPSRVVYVSCDPATLARDLKVLCGDGGYRLEKVQAVDQFPRGVHVESVVRLSIGMN